MSFERNCADGATLLPGVGLLNSRRDDVRLFAYLLVFTCAQTCRGRMGGAQTATQTCLLPASHGDSVAMQTASYIEYSMTNITIHMPS